MVLDARIARATDLEAAAALAATDLALRPQLVHTAWTRTSDIVGRRRSATTTGRSSPGECRSRPASAAGRRSRAPATQLRFTVACRATQLRVTVAAAGCDPRFRWRAVRSESADRQDLSWRSAPYPRLA
ncbi:hypothetical protein GCM10010168_63710 [Actinoplanes ianthinogenes]|uniref:Uncharacterized protein n=1 Tax=Actinoplanes ianthinogenes TaxID=122358 RepID=A0ABM7LJG9_9ACTN|nr:hypothetical protein Aiant_00380 [Actinoplanes ianthinogenes]GGR36519.1 hypothetical protein GCM10010168_63710 [Actinoplanes ianthinogenes]